MAIIIADIYEKFTKGEHLSTSECVAAFKHFDDLQVNLYLSGPVFLLAAREARRVRDQLEQYLCSRRLAKLVKLSRS